MLKKSTAIVIIVLLLNGCERQNNKNSDRVLDNAIDKISQGRVTELTVEEMDAWREKKSQDAQEHKRAIEGKQNKAREEFTDKEMQIYKYMKGRWEAIAESASGYDPDIHDDLVTSEAATKFGISKEEAGALYIKIDLAGLNL